MEIWNEHILPSISFGTEMKSKIERAIEHTNISVEIKMCMKVIGYPHHQFAVLADHPVVVSQFPISII